MNNLPSELVDRINRTPKRSVVQFETNSGGFIPYTSMTRRSQSIGSTVLSNNASVVHVAETSHWLTRNEVQSSFLIKWKINKKKSLKYIFIQKLKPYEIHRGKIFTCCYLTISLKKYKFSQRNMDKNPNAASEKFHPNADFII